MNKSEAIKKFFKVFNDQKVLLFIDGLDERQREDDNKILEDFFKYSRNKNVKLIVTCKSYYWDNFLKDDRDPTSLSDNLFQENDEKKNKGFYLSQFEDNQFKIIISKYRKTYNFHGKIDSILLEEFKRNPYLLRIAFEYAYKKNVNDLDVSSKGLFNEYYLSLIEPFKDEEHKKYYLKQISQLFYDLNTDKIPIDVVLEKMKNDIPNELIKWNILVKEQNGDGDTFISYYFSKLRDYIIAFKLFKWHEKTNLQITELLNKELSSVQLEVLNSYYLIAEKKQKMTLSEKQYKNAKAYLEEREKLISNYFSTFKKSFKPYTGNKPCLYCGIDLIKKRISSYSILPMETAGYEVVLDPSFGRDKHDLILKDYPSTSIHSRYQVNKKIAKEDVKDELFKIIKNLKNHRYYYRIDLSKNKYALIERILALISKNYNDPFNITKVRPTFSYLPIKLEKVKDTVLDKIVSEQLINKYLKINKYDNPTHLSFWDFRKSIKNGSIYDILDDLNVDLEFEISKICSNQILLDPYLENIDEDDLTILEDIENLDKLGINTIKKPIFPDWDIQGNRDHFSFSKWNKSVQKKYIKELYETFLNEYMIFVEHNFSSICSYFPFYSSLPSKIQITLDFQQIDRTSIEVKIYASSTKEGNAVEIIDTKKINRNNLNKQTEKKKKYGFIQCGSLSGYLNIHKNSSTFPRIPWHMDILQQFLYDHLEEDLEAYYSSIERERLQSFIPSSKLEKLDKQIFGKLCEIAFSNDNLIFDEDNVNSIQNMFDIDELSFNEIINKLEMSNYLSDICGNILGNIKRIYINPYAFIFYAENNMSEFSILTNKVKKYIGDHKGEKDKLNNRHLSDHFKTKKVVINAILIKFEKMNLLKTNTSCLNGFCSIYEIIEDLIC